MIWNKFIQAGYIKPLDLQLARHLAKQGTDELHAFLIHLSVSIRKGHLCIDPKLNCREVWELTEVDRENAIVTEEDWRVVESMVQKGWNTLPESLVQTPTENQPLNLNPILLSGSKVYTQRSWIAETTLKQSIKRFCNTERHLTVTENEILEELIKFGLENSLLPEQKNGILQSASPLSLIAGGPGTGKTYTAGWILSIFSELLSKKLGRAPLIALAAPTGKAALHLEESVKKRLEKTPLLITGTTLHQLLSKSALHADLIIVDEASMIDIEMMNKLFKEVPQQSRLILMGDPNQLPPVGMGSAFVDMIETMPHTHLKTCVRTDLQSIVDYANAIKNGVYTTWENLYPLRDQEQVIDHCIDYYRTCNTFEDFAKFKILTPFSKGPFGTEQLNQQILNALDRPNAIPILITKNDYDLKIFNGELGLWIPSKGVVQLPSRSAQEIREIPLSLIGSYQLGYCLTIHKSQGSEYDRVMIVYPEGAQIFGREAIYTAVTRAKKTVEIFASKGTLEQAVLRSNRRISGYTDRIYESAP